MRKFLAVAGVLFLAACNLLPGSMQTDITKFLTGLSQKVTTDLTNAQAVANAATPVDTAGVDCASALLEVQADVNKVVVASNAAGSGIVTAAEVASLFQPGSLQANTERDKLVKGCSVKVAQVSGAIAGTALWFGSLAGMFAIPIPGA